MGTHGGKEQPVRPLKRTWLMYLFGLGTYQGMNVPGWRRPVLGYVVALLLSLMVFLTFIIGWLGNVDIPAPPISTFLLFFVTFVAYFWGVGPSLCMLLFGTFLCVDLFLRPLVVGPLFPHNVYQAIAIQDVVTMAISVATGILIGVIVFQREKARLHMSEKERLLRESQQQLEECMRVVSHELKTPLASILAGLQLAKRKIQRQILPYIDGEQIRQHTTSVLNMLQQAEKAAHVQTRLVDDLLDASRAQSRTLTVIRTRCNLGEVVENVVDRYRQSVPGRLITLEIPDHAVIVYGDADRLDQVVSNYLSNALKYSPAEKPIAVKFTSEEHMARVAVSDKGPGLASEEHDRIWQRFYRSKGINVQPDSGVPNVGLGVGLALSKAIIEQHNGAVGVKSSPGQGSTFWFTVPLYV
jgi:signal transduction histidine kinase